MSNEISQILEAWHINAGFPNALLIVACGLLVAHWVKNIVLTFFDGLKFDAVLQRIGWDVFMARLHPDLDVVFFFGRIAQVSVMILTGMVAAEIIELNILSQFLEKVTMFLPNVVISVLIFILAVYAVDFAQRIVVGTMKGHTIRYSRFLGRGIDWSVRVVAVLAILYQLHIVPQLILVLFTGFVLALALACGIALGFAGRKPVSDLLSDLEQTFLEHK